MSTILTRRGGPSDWAAANPTLAEGEWGFDGAQVKIGDGTTPWNALDPTPLAVSALTLIDDATGHLMQITSHNDQMVFGPKAPGATKPTVAPTLNVTAGDATVSMVASPVSGALYYQFYKDVAGVPVALGGLQTSATYVDTPVANGVAVQYAVAAANAAGLGPISAFSAAVTPNPVSTSVTQIAIDCGGDGYAATSTWLPDSATNPSKYLTKGNPAQAFNNPGADSIPGSGGGYTLVQAFKAASNNNRTAGVPTTSQAAPSSVTAGNRLVIFVNRYDSQGGHSTTPTPTATGGLTFTRACPVGHGVNVGVDLEYIDVFVSDPKGSTGAVTVTATAPTNSSGSDNVISFDCFELHGLPATGTGATLVDVYNVTNAGLVGSSGAFSSGSTGTTTAAGQLAMLHATNYGSADSFTNTSGGFTTESTTSNVATSPALQTFTGLKTSALGATESGTLTSANGDYAFAIVVVFKTATAGDPDTPSTMYQTERYDTWIQYTIPVVNGFYDVSYFGAEQFAADEVTAGRIMNISINGTIVDAALDIFALSGANAGTKRTYTVGVTTGQLVVDIQQLSGDVAHISGLTVKPNTVTSAPTAPVLTFTVGVLSGTVDLTWTRPATALTYQVKKAGVAVGLPISGNTLRVTGLTDGGSGTVFEVTATNAIGSTDSNNVTVITSAPVAPTNSRGPDPTYTQPTGSVTVAVGQLSQALINSHPNGTIFWLLAGDHRITGSLSLTSSQLHGAPGAKVNGSADISSGWTLDATTSRYWKAVAPLPVLVLTSPDGVEIAGFASGLSGYTHVNACDCQDLYKDKVTMLPQTAVGNVTVGSTTQYFHDTTNNRMWIGVNPAGHQMETPAFTVISVLNGAQVSAIQGTGSGFLVRNIQFECFGTGWCPILGWNVVGASDGATNCTFQLSHTQGVRGFGGRLLNCIVTHNGQLGLAGGIGLVDNCEISYNNENFVWNVGWEAGGGKYAGGGSNTEARNSWYHHNGGNGFWFDTAGTNNLIHHNTFENNMGSGFQTEASGPTGNAFYNNIARNNALMQNLSGYVPSYLHWWVELIGVGIQDSVGWNVHDNYCYGNVDGPLAVYTSNNRTIGGITASSNCIVNANFMEFYQNPTSATTYNTGGSPAYSAMFKNEATGYFDAYNSVEGSQTWTNNSYFAKAGSAGTGGAYFGKGTSLETFAARQARGKESGSSMTSGSITAAPGTVGAPNNP